MNRSRQFGQIVAELIRIDEKTFSGGEWYKSTASRLLKAAQPA